MADEVKHAFPFDGYGQIERGMTLRDWFASQALAGMLTKTSLIDSNIINTVNFAYKLANAMLAERNKNDTTR